MKRFFSFLLALMMLVSLAACSEGGLSLKPGGTGGNKDGDTPSPSTSSDKQDDKNDSSNNDDGVILPDEDGVALGYEGDTLRTAFFEMSINNPYTCDEFDGLTPNEGYKFLVAELTLYNHTFTTQPMMDIDFEVIWDLDDEDAWAWPECDEAQDENGEPVYYVRSEQQLPVEYDLGIHKSVTGILLYQVPEDAQDFFINFYEIYENKDGETEYGDSFYVLFSA